MRWTYLELRAPAAPRVPSSPHSRWRGPCDFPEAWGALRRVRGGPHMGLKPRLMGQDENTADDTPGPPSSSAQLPWGPYSPPWGDGGALPGRPGPPLAHPRSPTWTMLLSPEVGWPKVRAAGERGGVRGCPLSRPFPVRQAWTWERGSSCRRHRPSCPRRPATLRPRPHPGLTPPGSQGCLLLSCMVILGKSLPRSGPSQRDGGSHLPTHPCIPEPKRVARVLARHQGRAPFI